MKLLHFPSKPEEMPDSTICRNCGADLGDHAHDGLYCPMYLGKTPVCFSGIWKFRAATEKTNESAIY